MKAYYGLGLAMLAGAMLGAGLVSGLHAQAKPPGYYIALVDPIDADSYNKEYASKVPPISEKFGGKYLSRGAKIISFVGEAPKRIVVIAFDSLEKVQAWQSSDAMKALAPMQAKYAKSQTFAVEGVSK